MILLDADVKRYSLYYGITFSIASVAFLIVVWCTGVPSDVKDCYFTYSEAMMHGIMPYSQGDLAWEYPPFSYVFMFIPGLFASTPTGYEVLFVVEVMVFFVIGAYVTGKIAVNLGHTPFLSMIIYAVLMMIMFEFLTDRFDIFPAILTLIAAYIFFFTRYKWLAFIILTIAAATKLYPALLIPLFMIPLCVKRNWREVGAGLLLVAVTTLVIMVPYIVTGVDYMSFLAYHTNRPMEVESLVSSIIMFASVLGITSSYVGFEYGSDNLYGPWADALSPCMGWFPLVLVFLIYVVFTYYVIRTKRLGIDLDFQLISIFGFITILVFILFGKVLSGQYPVWLIPFMLLIILAFPREYTIKSKLLWCFILSEIFTQLDFAVNYGLRNKGEDFSDMGVMIVLVRNLLLIGCLIISYHVVKRDIRSSDDFFNVKSISNKHSGP